MASRPASESATPREAGARKPGYHHGDLRAVLLREAGRALEADGPEALSMRAVARAAKVSQTAPYNHFENKDDLLAQLAGEGFAELAASHGAIAARATSPRDRLLALGANYLDFARRVPQRYRLMFGVGLPNWRANPAVSRLKASSIAPIKAVLAELAAAEGLAGDVDAAAHTAWALVHGLAMLRIDQTMAAQDSANEVALEAYALQALLDGLVARG